MKMIPELSISNIKDKIGSKELPEDSWSSRGILRLRDLSQVRERLPRGTQHLVTAILEAQKDNNQESKMPKLDNLLLSIRRVLIKWNSKSLAFNLLQAILTNLHIPLLRILSFSTRMKAVRPQTLAWLSVKRIWLKILTVRLKSRPRKRSLSQLNLTIFWCTSHRP